MPVLKDDKIAGERVREGLHRKLVYLDNLMTAVLDFSDGPWSEPEPFHSHAHEQISYVINGEVLFFCEDETAQRLMAGDIFYVPSGKKHRIQLVTSKARLIDNFSPIREDFLTD